MGVNGDEGGVCWPSVRATHHITAQPRARHGGKVRSASIILAPPNNGDPSQLAYLRIPLVSQLFP